MRLSKNFSLSEFKCPCCGKVKQPPQDLIDILQDVRDTFGMVKITSAYRCEQHNSYVGGVKNSYHLKGVAADIQVKNTHPSTVQNYLRDHDGGLGLYSTFTHIDVRGYKVRF